MIICHEGKKRTSTHFQDIFRQHSLRPSIVEKMIMTGRYKVTGHIFSSSVFNSFAFVPQSGKVEKARNIREEFPLVFPMLASDFIELL